MREAHVCGVCRTVLDWAAPFDGSPGRWQHTQANRAENDHDVVPVPRREMTNVRTRCDFCGEAEPGPVCMFVLPDRLKMPIMDGDGKLLGGTTDDDGLWGACAECAAIVGTSSAAKLTAHVARRMTEATGEEPLRAVLYRMYVTLLAQPRLRVELNEEGS